MFPLLGRDNRILMLTLIFWALGEGLWFSLRPIYIEQLGATPSQVGLVLAVEGIARVLLLIPGGWLSDRIGPRNVLLLSWIIGTLGAVMMALAPDWRWMAAAVFVYGLTYFVIPALSSYILLALPDSDRSAHVERAMTTVFASHASGLILSQLLGGFIADRFDIRTAIWIGVGLLVVSTGIMTQLKPYHSASESTTGGLRKLSRNAPFAALVIFFFLAMFGMTLSWSLAPIFLHNVRGFPLRLIGVFASLLSVGTVLWSSTLGRLRARVSLTATMALVWLSSLILLQFSSAWMVGAAYVLLGGFQTARALMSASIAGRVESTLRGTAFGISEVAIALGFALSPRVAGSLYEVRPQLPFVASIVYLPVLAIGSAVLLSVLRRRSAVRVVPAPRRSPL